MRLFIFFLITLPFFAAAQKTDYRAQAKDLVAKMTLEEKASLCSGQTAWTTKPIERLGIPSIFMTDGPHGLRKAEGFDFTNSVPATCFPTASALASSWNPELAQKVGVALGEECQANDVQILLGPGVNMKRSPLGGRNFEYFSEDPVLAGKMAVGLINGVQSQGVGTSLKHFAANNQEFERMTNNSVVDERTLREIYFPAFETAVKEANPWTVMCSYNRLNGTYASENPWLLTDVLRKDWGFHNIVVSDWGAVNDRPAGVQAGLNLEMPASSGLNDKKIVEAVNKGNLDVKILDAVVTDMLALTLQAKAAHKTGAHFDAQQHHDLARQAGAECVVLLKNKGNILPVSTSKPQKVAIIGAFAKNPRYQGAGSSQVKPTQLSNAWDELSKAFGKSVQMSYAAGYPDDAAVDAKLIADAQAKAKNANIAIIFAGLPSSYESEGFDRANMDMPASHNQLIEAVAKVQPNVVVVLMNGSAVSMPWASQVKGILEGWLTGQAGGGALADVLTGKVNPSGKLSETFPARLEDTPVYPNFPGQGGEARYGEGLFIGYRYYDKKKVEPLFPFGFGLSYTKFAYSGISSDKTAAKDTDPVTVSVKVKNTGLVAGQEVVQLYVHDTGSGVLRPEKELKHFAKVALKPGEEKTVSFQLGFRDYAWYDTRVHDWVVPSGKFDVLVGGSSRNLPLRLTLDIQSTQKAFPHLDRMSLMKEFAANPKGKGVYDMMLENMIGPKPEKPSKEVLEQREKMKTMFSFFLNDMPISKIVSMSQGQFTEEMLQGILQMINQ